MCVNGNCDVSRLTLLGKEIVEKDRHAFGTRKPACHRRIDQGGKGVPPPRRRHGDDDVVVMFADWRAAVKRRVDCAIRMDRRANLRPVLAGRRARVDAASPAQDQSVDADGLRYILDALLAEIFEFERQLFHDVIVNAAGDANTAGIRQPFQTRRDIHPIAENIPVLQHDVANIDSDAKLHPAIFFNLVVRVSEFIQWMLT